METIGMMQRAFGDGAVSAVQMAVWRERRKDGREAVGSDPRSGRPAAGRTPENDECVQATIHKDGRLTV